MPQKRKKSERCTWCMNNFDRHLKDRWAAFARLEGERIVDFTEYWIARIMREQKLNER